MPLKGYDGTSFADIDSNDSPAGGPFEQGRIYAYDGQYQNRIYPDIPEAGISRWTFDDADTNSGTALDVWGTNDGTISGATTSQSGANVTYDTGKAYDFDGSDDSVTSSISSFGGEQQHTVSFWVKAPTKPGSNGYYPMVIGPAKDDLTSGFKITGSGRINWFFFGNDIVYGIDLIGTGWNHIVATYSGGASNTQNRKLYINGIEATVWVDNTDGDPLNLPSNPQISLAFDAPRTQGYLDGKLDDVRIYDKGLTDTEVERLYNVGAI